jgi:uncharacterized protein YyaL (SSP411 family)
LLGLQLYNVTGQQQYGDTALMLYHWVNQKLKAADKLFYDAVQLPLQQIDTRKFTYNTGTMLQRAVLLFQQYGDTAYLAAAQAISRQSLLHFYNKGYFSENYWFNAVLLRGYEALYKADGNHNIHKNHGAYAQIAGITEPITGFL